MSIFKKLKDLRGAALVEYGLLIGLLAVVSIGAMQFLGRNVAQGFCEMAGNLSGEVDGSAAFALNDDDECVTNSQNDFDDPLIEECEEFGDDFTFCL